MRHTAREAGGIFQSTPPVKAATANRGRVPCPPAISIHAAREGGDTPADDGLSVTGISIHAAREGGDDKPILSATVDAGFQSTPPVKAATNGRLSSESED